MELESLDTNAIMRLIVGDIKSQQQKVAELLCRRNIEYRLDSVAIVEVVFALSRPPYNFSRLLIRRALLGIFKHLNIVYENGIIENSLNDFVSHPKLSFVDCYLSNKAQAKTATPLWTFDKKLAAQSEHAKLIS